jgi:hypothetical protein
METGVEYNKRRLHKVGYFRELLSTNEEVNESIRPLLKLSRETIVRLQKTEYALLSSLQRDPLLAERIQRLRTVPGVGPITALTWALEMGDTSRFRSIRQAISYCGLCGDEKSSADKVMRTPLSKQAQQTHPTSAGGSRQAGTARGPQAGSGLCNRKAERKCQSGDAGRSSENGGISAGSGPRKAELRAGRRAPPNGSLDAAWENIRIRQCAGCQVPRLPTARRRSTPEALSELFRDWQRTQAQSSVTALRGLRQGMDVRFCEDRNPCREAPVRTVSSKS